MNERAREEDRDGSLKRRVLWAVLAINATYFVIELVAGLLSGSMGLVADSLDMLADAFVYGMSLAAVGGALARKRSVARWAGWIQLALALTGFVEVLRRFSVGEGIPDAWTMVVVSSLALVANSVSLVLLRRAQSREVHIRASVIFTSNDVLINLGVIAAAMLVALFQSPLPDLVVGTIVFTIVARGALQILSLANADVRPEER